MSLQSSARKVQDYSKTAADTGVKTVQVQSHFVVESLKRNNATFAELIDARIDTFYDSLTAGSFKGFLAHNAEFRATAKDKLQDLYGSNMASLQNLGSELKSLYGIDKLDTDRLKGNVDSVVKKFSDAGKSLKSAITSATETKAAPKAKKKPTARKAAPKKASPAPKKAAPAKAAPIATVSPATEETGSAS